MTRGNAGAGIRRGAALLVLLAVWESLSRAGWLDPFYMPPPTAVGQVMFTLAAGGELWPHLGATATAALAGLLLGLAIGIALGFAAALSPVVAELLEPVMILLNAIPRVILAPLFVIWLGIGLASKLALATILVAVLIFFSVFNGIKEVDRRLVERVRTLGGGRRVLIREVYVPSVTAWVLGNFKVAVGVRVHRRRRRRVRRLQPRSRLPAPVRPEHLQRGADHRPDRHHHDVRAGAVRPRRPARTAPAAVALSLNPDSASGGKGDDLRIRSPALNRACLEPLRPGRRRCPRHPFP